MRKKRIRICVGFPLGVFAGGTLLLCLATGARPLLAVLLQLMPFSYLLNLWLYYFLFGIVGMLSVSLATLFEDVKQSILKQVMLHSFLTFAMISILLVCLLLLQSHWRGMIAFVLVYFLAALFCYGYLNNKMKKEVHDWNQLLKEREI